MRAPEILIFGLIGLSYGCAHSDGRTICGNRDALFAAVFDYQFANNRSSVGQAADTYFIGLENGEDPNSDLLRRFDGRQPPVQPLSSSGRSGNRVVNAETGQPALIFQIFGVTEMEDETVLVETGYYEAELSASWVELEATCHKSGWRVVATGPEMIS